MSDNESNTRKISDEFIKNVKKYLEIDDKLKQYKEETKMLNSEKKEKEEYILDYLQSIDEKVIDIPNGKLKKNISKTQTPLKKDIIEKTLTNIFNDQNKASTITDQIIKSRPYVERLTLKRTSIRNK
jgi:hypothetical protein